MINNDYDLSLKSKKQNISTNDDSSPVGRPKKDFQKVMEKEEGGEGGRKKNENAQEVQGTKKGDSFEEVSQKLASEEPATRSAGVSLFDLAKKTPEELEAAQTVSLEVEVDAPEGLPKEVKEKSLKAIFHAYGLKDQFEALQKESKKSTQESSLQFSKAPSDLAAVPFPSSHLSPSPAESAPPPSVPQASRLAEIKEVVDQIINKLYTIETKGKTDLVIKLSHPPLLAGSSIVITAFDSARREFNITFENLSQAAQKILGAIESQNHLKSALEQKGFVVHIITATTLSETTNLVEGRVSETSKRRQEDDEYPPNQQNKKRHPR